MSDSRDSLDVIDLGSAGFIVGPIAEFVKGYGLITAALISSTESQDHDGYHPKCLASAVLEYSSYLNWIRVQFNYCHQRNQLRRMFLTFLKEISDFFGAEISDTFKRDSFILSVKFTVLVLTVDYRRLTLRVYVDEVLRSSHTVKEVFFDSSSRKRGMEYESKMQEYVTAVSTLVDSVIDEANLVFEINENTLLLSHRIPYRSRWCLHTNKVVPSMCLRDNILGHSDMLAIHKYINTLSFAPDSFDRLLYTCLLQL